MRETEILTKILTEAGLVSFILAIACIISYRAYLMERKERQAAQKALSDLVKETNDVLQKINLVLNSINERLR